MICAHETTNEVKAETALQERSQLKKKREDHADLFKIRTTELGSVTLLSPFAPRCLRDCFGMSGEAPPEQKIQRERQRMNKWRHLPARVPSTKPTATAGTSHAHAKDEDKTLLGCVTTIRTLAERRSAMDVSSNHRGTRPPSPRQQLGCQPGRAEVRSWSRSPAMQSRLLFRNFPGSTVQCVSNKLITYEGHST